MLTASQKLPRPLPVTELRDRLLPPTAPPGPQEATEIPAPEPPGERPRNLWELVRPYAVKYRGLLVLTAALNALPGLAIAFQTVAPKYLVDWVLTAPGLDEAARYGRLATLLGLWLVAALGLRMVCWYLSYRVFTHVREQVVMELRARFFRHINQLCLRFHSRHSSGDLYSYVLGSPIATISGHYHGIMMNVPNAIAAFVISAAWIFTWDWALTLLLLALVGAAVFIVNTASADLRHLQEDFQQAEMEVSGTVADIFRGNREVKLHAAEEKLAATFEESADLLRRKTCHRDIRMHHVNMRHEAAGAVLFAALMALAALRYLQGVITAGELFAYIGAYFALQGPVSLLFGLGTSRSAADAAGDRLVRLLGTDTTTPDPAEPVDPPSRADLRLEGVGFAYDEGGAPVLRGVDVTIPFGQKIALVGPSGAGKTTLAKLLMRLHDPTAGRVTLGGVDLRRCRGQDVRRKFGIVPQEPYFFRGSIRENLRLVHPTADEAALRRACEQANAWEFIARLPRGLDEVVGEGALRLSTGQKQRLAIARALLHEPDYVVLDEATSALDTINEGLIRDALDRSLEGRTAVFIAHRLGTIRRCDRVLVIEDGGVVQDGTFDDLAARPGLLRRLVEQDGL